MFDDDIKAGLDAIAERTPMTGDLEAIRSAGLRKARLRSVALAVTAAVLLLGGGIAVRTLATNNPTQLSTDVADDSLNVNADVDADADADVDAIPDKNSDSNAEASPVTSPEGRQSPDNDDSSPTASPTTVDDQSASTTTPEQTSTSVAATVDVGFACQTNSLGIITWTDENQDRYGIYRSIDDGATYAWLARTLGQTIYSDPEFQIGHRYQVGYEGLDSRMPCTNSDTFACQTDALGTLRWTSGNEGPYRIERSIDGGNTFTAWEQSIDGETTTDSDYSDNHRYRIDHDGLAKPVTCSISTEFICRTTAPGQLIWSNRDEPRYRIYRSTNDGDNYTWLVSVDGETSFSDPDHQDGYRYRIDYEGLTPRIDCY